MKSWTRPSEDEFESDKGENTIKKESLNLSVEVFRRTTELIGNTETSKQV